MDFNAELDRFSWLRSRLFRLRLMLQRDRTNHPPRGRLAAIEYHGLPGISRECEDAVLRLLQSRETVNLARILTCDGTHCLLLSVNVGEDLIAVKSGFSSGYSGTGPRALSQVLGFLHALEVEIEEHDVSAELIDRLDASALTVDDIASIRAGRPVRPSRWYDYIWEEDWESRLGVLWQHFPLVIPFALVDDRIVDLAISFWEHPDAKLLDAYRRLEDIVRKRTQIDEHGTRLFSQAFSGLRSKLYWQEVSDVAEHGGRANLFTATYGAYRNPRAHREPNDGAHEQVTEFLLLNHLYLLERQAVERPPGEILETPQT